MIWASVIVMCLGIGFAAGLLLGGALGCGKADDAYCFGYREGLKEKARREELDLHDIERLYAAETDE